MDMMSKQKSDNVVSSKNVFSIDVEDYFHVAAFSKVVSMSDWSSYKSRVVRNTEVILDMLDKHHVKATFFVLGWVCEKEPGLIKKIYSAGHEIASHGYSHQMIYNQTPEKFREETLRSKKLLEDVIGEKVRGYRAASYSITKKSLWALDILAEAGFEYDSSIFPVRHDNYGLTTSPVEPYKIITASGAELIEFPLTSLNVFGYRLPVAGGGYFRLFPFWFVNWALKRINATTGRPFLFYIHPWEVDTEQPKIEAGFKSSFRHYNNLDKCEARLNKLLNNFPFGRFSDYLQNSQVDRILKIAELN